jgi:hypothetical protein
MCTRVQSYHILQVNIVRHIAKCALNETWCVFNCSITSPCAGQCKFLWAFEKIHCRKYSQIVMRGGWWGRTRTSLHYPSVFGCNKMTKMYVFKVAYQSFPKKTQFALSNCVWVVRNDQNVCFRSCLSIFPLETPVCTIQLCLVARNDQNVCFISCL